LLQKFIEFTKFLNVSVPAVTRLVVTPKGKHSLLVAPIKLTLVGKSLLIDYFVATPTQSLDIGSYVSRILKEIIFKSRAIQYKNFIQVQ